MVVMCCVVSLAILSFYYSEGKSITSLFEEKELDEFVLFDDNAKGDFCVFKDH